ncbi:MAG: methyltransferase domain-containing protein [Candidatus Omnitrophica bacterium]|nr:methyltransferase domain-containing protein [Candidatus Omnitrophota bacterium]
MTAKKTRSMEKRVLKVYRKENPSTYFIDRSQKDFHSWESKRVRLFRDLLHFPIDMFLGKTLIDLGAGTGENTVQYARWGATCTLVEMNDLACARARMIFDKFAPHPKKHKIINSSIFDFSDRKKYDIVVSNGAIHHTSDKEGAFSIMNDHLKEGGYLFLGINSKAGCFQRMLQRAIIFRFARTEEDIVDVAEELFREDISRAQKFGKRTRRAIIYDEFVNPKTDYPAVSEVLKWMSDKGLRYYSSYPPILLPVFGDSGMRPTTMAQRYPDIGVLAEALWMTHKRDDIKEVPWLLDSFRKLAETQYDLIDYVNDFSPNSPFNCDSFLDMIRRYRSAVGKVDLMRRIGKKQDPFFRELCAIIRPLKRKDKVAIKKRILGSRHIFKGTNGLGMMYFMAYKPTKEDIKQQAA